MAQVFNNKKKIGLFSIVSIAVVLFGIAIFLIAYGISDGWDVVAGWFISKYAILLYILIGCYGLLVLFIFVSERIKKL